MDSNFQVKITADLGDLAAKIKNIEATLRKLDSSFKTVSGKATSSLQKTGEAAATAGLDMNRMRLASFALGQVIRDSGFFAQSFGLGLLAISNNIPILIDQLVMLTNVSKGLGAAISLAGSVLTAILTIFAYASMGADKYNDSLDRIRATADVSVITLNTLLTTAKNQQLTDEARQGAINKLNKDYNIYNDNLSLENINTKAVTESTKKLIDVIYLQAEAEVVRSQLLDEISNKRKMESGELKNAADTYDKIVGYLKMFREGVNLTVDKTVFGGWATFGKEIENVKFKYTDFLTTLGSKKVIESQTKIDGFRKELQLLTDQLGEKGGISDPEKNKEEEERLKRIRDVYKELDNELKKIRYDILSSDLEKANSTLDAHKKALESLLDAAVSPLSKGYRDLQDSMLKSMMALNDQEGKLFAAKLQTNLIAVNAEQAAQKELDAKKKQLDIEKQLSALGNDSVAGEITDDQTYEILKRRNAAFDETNEKVIKTRELLMDLGNVIVGPLSSAFETMMQTGKFSFKLIYDAIKQVVIKLIAAVAAAALLALIISALTGGTAATAKGGGFLKAFRGLAGGSGLVPNAKGGVYSGPTAALVGEYPGAKNNPEVIAPLDKLKSLIGSSGGGEITGQLEARISGNDLVILMNRASKNRNGYY